MLRVLLHDRFGLIVRQDTRPMPAFALIASRNKPKLTASNSSGFRGCERQPQPAAAISVVYACRGVTMDEFAPTLRQIAADYLAAPVVNETGLEGTWDFDLRWENRSHSPQPGATRATIFDAVGQQLGLNLVLKTAPQPALVVERVNEKPTPNRADIESLLPARAAQFEVADLKLSGPGETGVFRLTPGRFEARDIPLPVLIGYGFDIYNVDGLVANLPSRAGEMHVDINGKLPFETANQGNARADNDLRLMVKNLLIERFEIKSHYEDRPVSAYSLASVKPKMKKADPSRRSSCKEAGVVKNDPRDSNPMLNRLVTCQNVTMTQFAGFLLGLFTSGYLDTPVEDATGLGGAWDFSINFTDAELLAKPTAGDGTAGGDPNGAISLQNAISKQLGLKLEKRRRPMPVLIIDHMDEKPGEN